jgi:hypothetical protein
VTELEQAEEALAQATARAEELAAMGSLELHAAVAGGPSHARALLGYHQRLGQLNRVRMGAWARVRELRAAQGLPPPSRFMQITPDFGPVPGPPPGSNVVIGKAAIWHRLLGALNGSDLSEISKCLQELEGWAPEQAPRQHG